MTSTAQKQEEFDKKLAALRLRFRRIRRRIRLLWVGYSVLSDGIAALILLPDQYPYWIFFLLINLLVSFCFMATALKQWNRRLEQQEEVLMEQAPVGKICL